MACDWFVALQVLDALEAQKQTAKKAAADEEAAAQKQLELQAAKKDLEVKQAKFLNHTCSHSPTWLLLIEQLLSWAFH